jgi:hypothetical protein
MAAIRRQGDVHAKPARRIGKDADLIPGSRREQEQMFRH